MSINDVISASWLSFHTSYVPTILKKIDHVTGKFTYFLPHQPDEKPVALGLVIRHMTLEIEVLAWDSHKKHAYQTEYFV
jgi:hypothetical protein